MTTLYSDTALRDDYCEYCGYPFDTGDIVTRNIDGAPFCGKHCANSDDAWKSVRDDNLSRELAARLKSMKVR